jgi:hypothetical protein
MKNEQELHRSVAQWLKGFLKRRYLRAEDIIVQGPSRSTIVNFLKHHGLLRRSQPESEAFNVKVDVIGAAVLTEDDIRLAIVEVELNSVNLSSLCRLLGLSQILCPSHAFIISPQGWTSSLQQLIRDFNRRDVLEYVKGRHIIVAKWDLSSASIRPGDVLTPGQGVV